MLGHPKLEKESKVYVPPSILHSFYQTSGSTSELFAHLLLLLIQSDSFIWLSADRWEKCRGSVFDVLGKWKGFSFGWDHPPCEKYVCTTTHTSIHVHFYISVSGRAHQNWEGRVLRIYKVVFRHFHTFWGCNISIMNFILILIYSVMTNIFFKSIMSYGSCNIYFSSYSVNM